MKKKISKKKQPKRQQKIDVVLASLLNLERVIKELVAQIEQLRYSQSRFKDVKIDSKKCPDPWFKPAWPSTDQPMIWQNTVTMSKE